MPFQKWNQLYKLKTKKYAGKLGGLRGLLCGSCNRAIGLFRDNQEFLANAIGYLNGR